MSDSGTDDADDQGPGAWEGISLDPGFRSAVVEWKGNLRDARECCRSEMGYKLTDATVEATPLREVEYGNLIAYMHRRHGPPNLGTYPGDDVHSAWLLTTPLPDLFLEVKPTLSGPGFCFHPLIDLGEDADPWWTRDAVPEARMGEVTAAYRTALLDLLRPIRVRDHHVNARGEDMWDDPGFATEGEDEVLVHEVDHHPSCGHATPPGVFGTSSWLRLMSLAEHLGGGDHVAGMEAAVSLLEAPARAAALAAAPRDARVLAASWPDDETDESLTSAFGIHADDLPEVARLRAARRRDAPPGGLDGVTHEAARSAGALLDALGHPNALPMIVTERQLDSARNRGLRDMLEATGGEWPACLAATDNPPTTPEVLDAPALLRVDGHEAAAAWAEATLAGPYGKAAVWHAMDRTRRKVAPRSVPGMR